MLFQQAMNLLPGSSESAGHLGNSATVGFERGE